MNQRSSPRRMSPQCSYCHRWSTSPLFSGRRDAAFWRPRPEVEWRTRYPTRTREWFRSHDGPTRACRTPGLCCRWAMPSRVGPRGAARCRDELPSPCSSRASDHLARAPRVHPALLRGDRPGTGRLRHSLSRPSRWLVWITILPFSRVVPSVSEDHARCNGGLGGAPNGWPKCLSLAELQLSPAAGFVVDDDLLQHGLECRGIDLLPPTNGNGTSGLVVVTAGDDPVRVRHDCAVVQKHIHTSLGRQKGTDVPLERKIRLPSTLDGLHHLRVRRVDQRTDLPADGLLPLG